MDHAWVAIPSLTPIRLFSHNYVSDAMTDMYMPYRSHVPRELVRRRNRMSVEIAYSLDEMLKEGEMDAEALFADAATSSAPCSITRSMTRARIGTPWTGPFSDAQPSRSRVRKVCFPIEHRRKGSVDDVQVRVDWQVYSSGCFANRKIRHLCVEGAGSAAFLSE